MLPSISSTSTQIVTTVQLSQQAPQSQANGSSTVIATSSSNPIAPPINPIYFIYGGLGGAVEAPARSVLDTAKSAAQLNNITTVDAIKKIHVEKGIPGFFPYIANTTAIRGVQRGGLFMLANSDMSIAVKTAIGFVYELSVTSVNQVITTHAAGDNKALKGNPFQFVYSQFKAHGMTGIISPWTATRNLKFLGVYNYLMIHFQEERKSNPLATNLGIGLASTASSHIFDPSSTHHTRYPELTIFEVPKAVYKASGIRGLLGNGLLPRLGSVGAGVVIYGTIADTIKRSVQA